VPAEIEPPELAQLIDYAERPRANDWSLRAALTVYAQPKPQLVGDLLDLVRRIEVVIDSQRGAIAENGPALWQSIQSGEDSRSGDRLVGLLRTMVQLDRLGDVLAAWAADARSERPDAQVEAVTTEVARRLDELGVPRQQRPRETARGS
jgi:hypothetical protein